MKLGHLQLDHPLILAPMSGITDYPFRRIAKENGCRLVFTEMISAEGLLRKGESGIRIYKDEHPVWVQLFGSNPEVLAEAAEMVETRGADGIDINMGCPAKKVVEAGAGVALMQFPEKVRSILSKVKKKLRIPLTIKIRSGWDKEHINAIDISKIAEECGVDAISIHPRMKVQGFCGQADWHLIREVKETVQIPVIGNGDVTTPRLAKRMMEETGCDGVMIGRGALGNPWIFSPNHFPLSEEKMSFRPSLEEIQRLIEYHFILLVEHDGEEKAIKKIRRHMVWYTNGLPSVSSFRTGLFGLKGKKELFEAMASFFHSISNSSSFYERERIVYHV